MNFIEARDLYRNALSHLHEPNEIDFYFKSIVRAFFELTPTDLALNPSAFFKVNQEKLLKETLKDLVDQKPLQYILKEVYFRNVRLKVDSRVLIPRPETEELVQWIVEDHRTNTQRKKVVDFGTGSGCIAIALAQEHSFFDVTAMDRDQEIITLARENALMNQTLVHFIQKDITHLDWNFKTDIMVSNPPYITPQEQKNIKKNVLDFEPHQALFVPQDDPLIFYRALLDYARNHLNPSGKIYFEINPLFLQELKKLILLETHYKISVRNDIFGKKRMLRLERL
ncbi:MAG: peptide chain release factor N(5)-glutamine methyltransferase [Flavobacteriaceae bacterium]